MAEFPHPLAWAILFVFALWIAHRAIRSRTLFQILLSIAVGAALGLAVGFIRGIWR